MRHITTSLPTILQSIQNITKKYCDPSLIISDSLKEHTNTKQVTSHNHADFFHFNNYKKEKKSKYLCYDQLTGFNNSSAIKVQIDF